MDVFGALQDFAIGNCFDFIIAWGIVILSVGLFRVRIRVVIVLKTKVFTPRSELIVVIPVFAATDV